MTATRVLLVTALAVLAPAGCARDEPAGPAADPVPTVFVGDSITRGVSPESLTPDATYSWVTYAVSEPGSPWLAEETAGQFGRTLPDMAAVFADEVLAHDPEGVVVMGGTNDVLRGLTLEPSMAALRSMVTAAQDAGAEVWVVAPPPIDPSFGRDLDSFVTAEAALADELGVPFIDVRADLAEADGGWREGLATDGIHPSEEGARRIATLVVAAATTGG